MTKILCDFEGCKETAYGYRLFQGQLFALCIKHEALCSRKHWGKHLKDSELTKEDHEYLAWKDDPIQDWMK